MKRLATLRCCPMQKYIQRSGTLGGEEGFNPVGRDDRSGDVAVGEEREVAKRVDHRTTFKKVGDYGRARPDS